MWWIIPAIQTVAAIGAHQANKGPRSYRRTEEEQKYLDRLDKNRKYGSIDVGQQMRYVGEQTQNQASQSKQEVRGRAIQSGMTSSIIQHELFRRVDRDTQKAISESSRQIAEANRQTMEQAQGSYDQFMLNESQAIRSNKDAQHQHKVQKKVQMWNTLGNLGSSWVGAAQGKGGPMYHQTLTSTRPTYGPNPNLGMTPDQLKAAGLPETTNVTDKRIQTGVRGIHPNYYDDPSGAGFNMPGGAGIGGYSGKSEKVKFTIRRANDFMKSPVWTDETTVISLIEAMYGFQTANSLRDNYDAALAKKLIQDYIQYR